MYNAIVLILLSFGKLALSLFFCSLYFQGSKIWGSLSAIKARAPVLGGMLYISMCSLVQCMYNTALTHMTKTFDAKLALTEKLRYYCSVIKS